MCAVNQISVSTPTRCRAYLFHWIGLFNAIRFISLRFTWTHEKWNFFNIVFQLRILKIYTLQTKTPHHCSSGKCWIRRWLRIAAEVARQHQGSHRRARHLGVEERKAFSSGLHQHWRGNMNPEKKIKWLLKRHKLCTQMFFTLYISWRLDHHIT